ncbi:hypothetical protein, partial [Phocaeicola sartorii]|uniref:hypothetical protein n=1 Tax=Phocaeicola sartorii TaxID=671267 RepID=UPI002599C1BB
THRGGTRAASPLPVAQRKQKRYLKDCVGNSGGFEGKSLSLPIWCYSIGRYQLVHDLLSK